MDNLIRLITLKNLPGVGNGKINSGLYNICVKNSGDYKESLILNGFKIQDIENAINYAETIYYEINKEEIQAVTILDNEYPKQLLALGNKKPVILYYYGNLSLLNQTTIGIIGTRKPSEWTKKVGIKIVDRITELTDSVIVSGLALGCDTIAHETALKNTRETIAVLPSGLLKVYPKENKGLFDKIVDSNGLVLSEYEPNISATKYSPIQRDSIVAALSDKMLALECALKSGTMTTLGEAVKLGKGIACYYSNESNKGDYSGCLSLISKGNAKGITDLEDLKKWLETKGTNSIQLEMEV